MITLAAAADIPAVLWDGIKIGIMGVLLILALIAAFVVLWIAGYLALTFVVAIVAPNSGLAKRLDHYRETMTAPRDAPAPTDADPDDILYAILTALAAQPRGDATLRIAVANAPNLAYARAPHWHDIADQLAGAEMHGFVTTRPDPFGGGWPLHEITDAGRAVLVEAQRIEATVIPIARATAPRHATQRTIVSVDADPHSQGR